MRVGSFVLPGLDASIAHGSGNRPTAYPLRFLQPPEHRRAPFLRDVWQGTSRSVPQSSKTSHSRNSWSKRFYSVTRYWGRSSPGAGHSRATHCADSSGKHEAGRTGKSCGAPSTSSESACSTLIRDTASSAEAARWPDPNVPPRGYEPGSQLFVGRYS